MTTRWRPPVIVTGGRGRLGRLLVEALRWSGTRAVSIGRSAPTHVDDVCLDLRDQGALTEIIAREGAQIIVHLATVLHGQDIAVQNDDIDRAVSRGAREGLVRHLVHVSSAAVYGTDQHHALREDSPLLGTSEYALSKMAAEARFGHLADAGVHVTSLRLFNVAGPDFPDSLVSRLLASTPDAPVTVTAPDAFVRDYVHQSDAVAVLLAAVRRGPTGERAVYNVGAGVPVSTRSLLAGLSIDRARIIEVPGEPSVSWADISLLRARYGLTPRGMPGPAWNGSTLDNPGGAV